MSGKIYIGTSGWHYKHWRGPFYPKDMTESKMLNYYLRFFDTVEINNSFYRLPTEKAIEEWRESTPKNFLFAVKASRYLTHMKKLKDPDEGLQNFLPVVTNLNEKLGPILFQLPPRWHSNIERLSAFLEALPKDHQFSFELRDRSWLIKDVYDLLKQYNAALCIYDLAGFLSPIEITADFTYIRLHGPGDAYQGDYGDESLKAWAEKILHWSKELKNIYVYFDNDQAGFAVKNGLQLKELIKQ
jgi:uncharacterized protein YecE (DUF72 family)